MRKAPSACGESPQIASTLVHLTRTELQTRSRRALRQAGGEPCTVSARSASMVTSMWALRLRATSSPLGAMRVFRFGLHGKDGRREQRKSPPFRACVRYPSSQICSRWREPFSTDGCGSVRYLSQSAHNECYGDVSIVVRRQLVGHHLQTYWLGGLGGSAMSIVLGSAGNVSVPLVGSGRENCGVSCVWLWASGRKG